MTYRKIIKKILLCGMFFIILFFEVSCTPKAVRKRKKNQDISLARIMLKKEFVVGLEYETPPFSYINLFSKSLDGYDIDVIKEMCKRMGVKPVFKDLEWTKKDDLLKSGEIDCIWNAFSYTKDRAKMYTLSMPYIRTAVIIAVMKDSPIMTFDDLKDKTIGVQEASSLQSMITQMAGKYNDLTQTALFPFTKIKLFATPNDALQAMERGEVDGVVHDLLAINNIINSKQRPYRVLNEALGSDEYVIAFKLGDIALKNKVEEILYDMAKTDFFEKASKKWFGANISLIGR